MKWSEHSVKTKRTEPICSKPTKPNLFSIEPNQPIFSSKVNKSNRIKSDISVGYRVNRDFWKRKG